MSTLPAPAHQAVCCLIMNAEGQLLAVSRTKKIDDKIVADLENWGMPGGKVETNETLEMAIVRETFEETGYVIADPQLVYTAYVPGEVNYLCTTFIGRIVAQSKDAPMGYPFEGDVAWVIPWLLAQGPFSEYNRALFTHLNLRISSPGISFARESI